MDIDQWKVLPTPRYELMLKSRYVGVEHLMMAILIEGKSVPAVRLNQRGDLHDSQAGLKKMMKGRAYGPPVEE
jgi:hypothetical protein